VYEESVKFSWTEGNWAEGHIAASKLATLYRQRKRFCAGLLKDLLVFKFFYTGEVLDLWEGLEREERTSTASCEAMALVAAFVSRNVFYMRRRMMQETAVYSRRILEAMIGAIASDLPVQTGKAYSVVSPSWLGTLLDRKDMQSVDAAVSVLVGEFKFPSERAASNASRTKIVFNKRV
jgi:hypothetical protein